MFFRYPYTVSLCSSPVFTSRHKRQVTIDAVVAVRSVRSSVSFVCLSVRRHIRRNNADDQTAELGRRGVPRRLRRGQSVRDHQDHGRGPGPGGRRRGDRAAAQRERRHFKEGDPMGDVPQGRPAIGRRRRGTRQAHRRHTQLGRGLPEGGPGHAVRADPCRQLSGHQGPVGRHVQDRGQHDQGQNARGDPQDVQHQKRLYGRRGGSSAQGERVVRRKIMSASACGSTEPTSKDVYRVLSAT